MIRTRSLTAAVLAAVIVAFVPGARSAHPAAREPARGEKAMVATAHELATDVGVDVLRRGGNAVDAAVAVALALAVVYPVAGNLGGGGFMVIRLADGRATAIDYRETAPAAASRDMYLDAKGDLVDEASTVGYRAAGVPGTPAGLELALERYGSMRWADLVEPARRLAERGFPVDRREARGLASEASKLERFADSRRIFLRDGRPYREGELLRQPELAATLARMQRRGAREFYEGETARRIAADMRANGGLITLEDLRGYRAREREPLRGRYRGHEIVTMPPPSSGGVVLLAMLQMLERFDLAEAGFGSSLAIHLQVEAMRRAFADRAEYLGDADFVDVPVARLISPEYAAERAKTIDPARASTSAEVGPGLGAAAGRAAAGRAAAGRAAAGRAPARRESEQTTHFTVVDGAGNVVANTYTLNLGYGSGVVAKGTGVLLNNEMDDFAAKPGTANAFGLVQRESNAIAPGKRPLSSMTPTIVLDRDGKLWFALGSPGGPTIINSVLQVIVNVVDFGMNLQQAVDAPRVHHQWLPDRVVVEPYMARDVEEALVARGHTIYGRARQADSVRPYIGDVHAVMIEGATGARLGASDSRNMGVAKGF